MKIKKKIGVFLIIFLILLIPIVSATTIVQVPTEPQKPKSAFQNVIDFFKSKFFIIFIICVVIVVLLAVGIFFLVKWLIKYFKNKMNIFFMVKSSRIKMCKIHRHYPSKSYFKFKKNTPIRLVHKDLDGKIKISNPIAYHKGDYVSPDGNVIIAFNMIGNATLWIFPKTEILLIPNKAEMTLKVKNEKTGKEEDIKISNIPTAKDIIQFNENEILLFAESISPSGLFYIPVLKTKDDKIIDMTLPAYQNMKDVAMSEFLYEQSDDFARVMKKSLDINPYIKSLVKLSDTNQQVDIPSSSQK